jgi:hypothetical protein
MENDTNKDERPLEDLKKLLKRAFETDA